MREDQPGLLISIIRASPFSMREGGSTTSNLTQPRRLHYYTHVTQYFLFKFKLSSKNKKQKKKPFVLLLNAKKKAFLLLILLLNAKKKALLLKS